jgi:hypothetical protein
MSTNIQFAEEKALLLAKKVIAEDIDNYIIEKCNYKSFLSDSEFEDKITIARNTILSDIKIICSKTMKKGEMYKSFIAVEISKEDVDKEISGRLNK